MARIAAVALSIVALAFASPLASAGPADSVPVIASSESPALVAARAKDIAAYEGAKAALHRFSDGQWVVIADGKVAAKGADLAGVRSVESAAVHRFVFQVGDDGDHEQYVTTWYAARFAGMAFGQALGLKSQLGSGEVSVEKDGVTVTSEGKSPFPRLHVRIGAPDGKMTPDERPEGLEMFLGTVGPTLAMTPDDAARLHLERFEVPGTMTLGGMPCRQVLVTTSVVGLKGDATIVATYPLAPRERLIDIARWRGKFWQWGAGGPIAKMPIEGLDDGEWIVFGNDRVLGHGKSPEDALNAADPNTEFAYHRYLLQIPSELPPAFTPIDGERPTPRVIDLRKLAKQRVSLNGRSIDARVQSAAPKVVVVSAADAEALHLELAESPTEARLVESDDPKAPERYARLAYAWWLNPALVDGKTAPRSLRLIAYERAKDPSDEPPSIPPGFTTPGMK